MYFCQLALTVNTVCLRHCSAVFLQISNHIIGHDHTGISWYGNQVHLFCSQIQTRHHIYVRSETVPVSPQQRNIQQLVFCLRRYIRRCHKIGFFRLTFPKFQRRVQFGRPKSPRKDHYQKYAENDFPSFASAAHFHLLLMVTLHSGAYSAALFLLHPHLFLRIALFPQPFCPAASSLLLFILGMHRASASMLIICSVFSHLPFLLNPTKFSSWHIIHNLFIITNLTASDNRRPFLYTFLSEICPNFYKCFTPQKEPTSFFC